MGLNDIHSLAHSKWNCKYHVVFAPKYIKHQLDEDKLGEQLNMPEVGPFKRQKRK